MEECEMIFAWAPLHPNPQELDRLRVKLILPGKHAKSVGHWSRCWAQQCFFSSSLRLSSLELSDTQSL